MCLWILSHREGRDSDVQGSTLFQDFEELFDEATDFRGRVFRATAFPYKPFSIIEPETNTYGGIEYTIANEVAKSLNMRMVVRIAPQRWGRPIPPANLNYSGVETKP